MKNFVLVLSGCGLGIGLVLLLKSENLDRRAIVASSDRSVALSSSDLHSAHSHDHNGLHGHTHHIEQYPNSDKHKTDDMSLKPRKEVVAEADMQKVDKKLFSGVTDDPAVMFLLSTYRTPSAGSLVKTPEGYSLTLNSVRFDAALIGKTRSVSLDGTVACDAITVKNGNYIEEIDAQDGGVSVQGNPGEVWVISPQGEPEKISPDDIHGKNPIISPDGRYVAYTAQYVFNNALHAKFLMVADRKTKKSISYSGRRKEAAYEIAPIDWVEDGHVLRVLEDWGETGGHMQLKQVNFN